MYAVPGTCRLDGRREDRIERDNSRVNLVDDVDELAIYLEVIFLLPRVQEYLHVTHDAYQTFHARRGDGAQLAIFIRGDVWVFIDSVIVRWRIYGVKDNVLGLGLMGFGE